MDLTNPAVLALLAAIVSAVTTALTSILMAWLGRRQSNAQAGVTEAEEERIRITNRIADEEAKRKEMDHRLSVIERSRDAKVVGLEEAEHLRAAEVTSLKEAMAALERSHAARVDGLKQGMDALTEQVKSLTAEVAGLKTLGESANETINQQGITLKEANETIVRLNKEVSDLKQTLTETTAAFEDRISDLIKQIQSLGKQPGEGETVAETAAVP